jgi:hypothetical protein
LQAPATQDGEYDLRRVMPVSLWRDRPGRVDRVLGMTHLRFNAEGRIVFQQGSWDPSDGRYSRIPVAGWLIRRVNARL